MVDKHDAPKGYIAVESTTVGCEGCAFDTKAGCTTDHLCAAENRKDRHSVIFVKKKKKSKRNKVLVQLTKIENKLDELLARV